jgi:hypothetical protein
MMNVQKQIVIDIRGAGAVEALHMDEFPLSFLGTMQIERASTIEFDGASQTFFVLLTDAATQHADRQPTNGIVPARGFSGYDVARKFEVSWLQESRKAGVDPLSGTGVEIAQAVRESSILLS